MFACCGKLSDENQATLKIANNHQRPEARIHTNLKFGLDDCYNEHIGRRAGERLYIASNRTALLTLKLMEFAFTEECNL